MTPFHPFSLRVCVFPKPGVVLGVGSVPPNSADLRKLSISTFLVKAADALA